jgi:mRNA interferase RelE/StbE
LRIRIGDYRVIYEVRDAELVIAIIQVGHRSKIYRGT